MPALRLPESSRSEKERQNQNLLNRKARPFLENPETAGLFFGRVDTGGVTRDNKKTFSDLVKEIYQIFQDRSFSLMTE